MYQFKFADIGEGLHEGKVIKIDVEVGNQIKEGDILFEVETDKVTSEITSPVNGKINEIKIKVDQIIHVGETVFLIDLDSKNDDQKNDSKLAFKEQPKESDEGGASVVGQVKVSNEVLSFDFNKKEKTDLDQKPNDQKKLTNIIDLKNKPKKLKISPYLMNYVLEKKIDLNLIIPSRADGIVTKKDLDLVLNSTNNQIDFNQKQNSQISSVVQQSVNNLELIQKKALNGFVAKREKTTSLRQAIAANLKNSWNQVAYTNLVVQADVTELWNLRSSIKDVILKNHNIKLTFLPYIAKATVIALSEHKIFTAYYDEKTQELVYPSTINLGIAVDTKKGLMVPNIKDAQTKSVLEFASEINELAKKARDGLLKGVDMANGTFTITNYGSAGALFGVPVIKYPEIAILGVGTIIDQVQSVSGSRKIMYLTIAADHRWVDGVGIGIFASKIKHLLENPGLLSVY